MYLHPPPPPLPKQSSILYLKSSTLNPQSQSVNPPPYTPNSKPYTLHPTFEQTPPTSTLTEQKSASPNPARYSQQIGVLKGYLAQKEQPPRTTIGLKI